MWGKARASHVVPGEKNLSANAGDIRDARSMGKIPWRRKWQPTLVFLPGEPRGQGSLAGYSPWGRKESDTTETTERTHIPSAFGDQPGGLNYGKWRLRTRAEVMMGNAARSEHKESKSPSTLWPRGLRISEPGMSSPIAPFEKGALLRGSLGRQMRVPGPGLLQRSDLHLTLVQECHFPLAPLTRLSVQTGGSGGVAAWPWLSVLRYPQEKHSFSL